MPYRYDAERPALFTEDGQLLFLAIRDKTQVLLKEAGACRAQEMMAGNSGSSWTMMACVDRLLELGEIREVTDPMKVWGQHRVFVGPRK